MCVAPLGLSMAFAHPDRLTGLVFVNGAGGPLTDEELAQWGNRTAEREALIEQTMQQIFADPARVPPSFRDDLRWQADHAAPGQLAAVAGDRASLSREAY